VATWYNSSGPTTASSARKKGRIPIGPTEKPKKILRFVRKREASPFSELIQTRTYGPRGRATKALDAGRPFKEVLIDDIHDLRRIAGNKYDDSIEGLLKYYEGKGLLDVGEIDLKKICRT
jgi:hypothetical protein